MAERALETLAGRLGKDGSTYTTTISAESAFNADDDTNRPVRAVLTPFGWWYRTINDRTTTHRTSRSGTSVPAAPVRVPDDVGHGAAGMPRRVISARGRSAVGPQGLEQHR